MDSDIDIDVPQSSDGNIGILSYSGSGFSACPQGDNSYQIFAAAVSPETRVNSNCISIDIGTAIVNGSAAPYQY